MSNVIGVGIDLVAVKDFKRQVEKNYDVFVKHTFTKQEIEDAEAAQDKIVFYAGRFAVKEAVFKALAHLHPQKGFDFRRVETKRDVDGAPIFVCNDYMKEVLTATGAANVLISISNEEDYVVAIAEAISE